MRLSAFPLILVAVFAATAPAGATPPAHAPQASDEALAVRLARDAEIADQNRRSEALNADVNGRNRAVEARNAATRAAFDKAMADYRAALARHDAEVKAMEADGAKAQAAYQRQVGDWKAAVAACKAGDVAKCQGSALPLQSASAAPPR